jgi:chromosome segregation ATPase
MENLEKILEIKVDVNEAIKGITNLNKEIGAQKQKQKELQSQIKELSKDYVTNADKIESLQQELTKSKEITKSYTSQVQTLSKQIQNQLKVDKEQLGSMKQLRAQLSNLTNAYDEMSEAERDSAEGQELKDKINEVTDALKECEEETQRYYRNVGNYENAISNAIGLNGRFGTTLKNVAEATKNTREHIWVWLTECNIGVTTCGVSNTLAN